MTQMKIELWFWTILAIACVFYLTTGCATRDIPQDEVNWIVQHRK